MKIRLLGSILLIIFLACAPASAIKISGGNGFSGMFHVGGVMGPGIGINFGLDLGMPVEQWELGLEAGQVITDYDFSISINATKIGGVARYELIEDSLWGAVHIGKTWFSVSKDMSFTDMFSGKSFALKSGGVLDASYISASLDYKLGDIFVSPRVFLNYIGEGAVFEFDLNVGSRF